MWKVFWLGGSAEGSAEDSRTPPLEALPERPLPVLRSMVWGASIPPTLAIATVLGLWLLAAPAVLGVSIRSAAADIAHIGGAFVVVAAVIAMAEVVRATRWLNVAGGAAIAAAALIVGESLDYVVVVALTGVAIAVASIPRGRVRESYADWRRLAR